MTIVPRPSPATARFWSEARAGRLVLLRCATCARWAHPQQIEHGCACGGELEWSEASGEGTVVAWTVVRRPAHPAIADEMPYTLMLVRTAEGPQLVSSLAGEGHGLRVGAEVRASFDEVGPDVAMVRFRPRGN